MATFGGSGYGSNIYGTTEHGGGTHVLLGYLATFLRLKNKVVGTLTRAGRVIGVNKTGV